MANNSTNGGQVFNNAGQISVQSGSIDVATIMGIANPSFKVDGQPMSFASAVAQIQFKKLTQNAYDNGWNKTIKIQAMGNEGTVQYTFMPAVLPVSNFAQTDVGNRSFGTQMNVFGKNIMFLQTNFWTNEFVALTDTNYLDNVQKMLLGTYSRSIAIMKTELSIMENTLFCLASGQFLFADEIGKKIQQDPTDPNNLMIGAPQILWSTQAPRKDALNTFLGNIPQAFLKQELNALSTWLMTWGMTITTFAIGFSLDQMALACSYYMRTNLAMALNLGWPTDTNMNLVQNPSYVKPALSQWYNMVLTDVNTLPYFQNEVGMVAQEDMGTVNGGTYSGSPLGYGINNICPMNYTRNIIAMTVYNGALEQYYTTEVPFNPYNIQSAKTWYRLGYTWGWGQVHVPNYWGTSWMLLDPNSYVKIVKSWSQPIGDMKVSNTDWVNASDNANGLSGDVDDEPTIEANGWYVQLGGTSSSPVLTLTTNPNQANTYPIGVQDINFGFMANSGNNPCSIGGYNTSCMTGGLTWNDIITQPGIFKLMYLDGTGVWQPLATTLTITGYSNATVFNDPTFCYYKKTGGNVDFVVYTMKINQLLDDMKQAREIELTWEDGMGYDTYCFQQLPNDIEDTLVCASPFELPSGKEVMIGNSCGFTFAQWATTRSLRALSMPITVNNKNNYVVGDNNTRSTANMLNLIESGPHQLLDVVRVGYDQLYMQPFQYMFTMPNGAPYINEVGYSAGSGSGGGVA